LWYDLSMKTENKKSRMQWVNLFYEVEKELEKHRLKAHINPDALVFDISGKSVILDIIYLHITSGVLDGFVVSAPESNEGDMRDIEILGDQVSPCVAELAIRVKNIHGGV